LKTEPGTLKKKCSSVGHKVLAHTGVVILHHDNSETLDYHVSLNLLLGSTMFEWAIRPGDVKTFRVKVSEWHLINLFSNRLEPPPDTPVGHYFCSTGTLVTGLLSQARVVKWVMLAILE
jgi:hypothetical protein